MIAKPITYFGDEVVLICDGQCNKAWGVNTRPYELLSEDPNDKIFFSDGMIGDAPVDPGTYEGGDAKPQGEDDRLNRWCARECERSKIVSPLEEFKLIDFTFCVMNKQERT